MSTIRIFSMDVDTYLVLVYWHVVMVTLQSLVTQGHRTLVMTDKGQVQGKTYYVHGKKVDVFYGIPYAKPPIGDLRFLHPEQLDPWQGVWDATKKPNCCIQLPDTVFGNFSGSNVWNPNTKGDDGVRGNKRAYYLADNAVTAADPLLEMSDVIKVMHDAYIAKTSMTTNMTLYHQTGGDGVAGGDGSTGGDVSEDCLYLSVWTPRTHPPYTNKAVIVWVYGGAFMTGSSVLDIYDGKYLATENDIVVVSMQFRFGALGYFVLGSPHSPGNAGMMDLRMALEWIQRNIHYFGGNPHNITLVGESSGAVSIGLFMLSSLGRGLFHRAILQSGAPQAPWGTYTLQEGRRRSLALAEYLGCDPKASDRIILECLRKVPAMKFPEEEIRVAEGVAQFPFIPVIDGTFLIRTPSQYLREGHFKKIPLLLGSNSNEGSWLLVYAEPSYFNIDTPSLVSKESYNVVMDKLFRYYPQYPYELNHLGKEAIKFQYTDWLDPLDQTRLRAKVEQAVGDYHFTCGVADMAKTVSEYGLDVYFYRFSHRMSTHSWPEWMGVLHGDEIFFVFGLPLNKEMNFTGDERKLSKKIMKLWTNFAKTGNPNRGPGEMEIKEWPKFRHNEQLFLDINLDILGDGNKWGQGVRPEHCAFWEHYVSKISQMTPSYINVNCSRTSASTSGTFSGSCIWPRHWLHLILSTYLVLLITFIRH